MTSETTCDVDRTGRSRGAAGCVAAVVSAECWHRRATSVQANSSLCSGQLLGTVKQCRWCWSDWTAGDTRLCANCCQTVPEASHCHNTVSSCLQNVCSWQCQYFNHSSKGDAVRRLFLVPQDFLWMTPSAETCSSLTFVMNSILLSVIKLVDTFVVTKQHNC